MITSHHTAAYPCIIIPAISSHIPGVKGVTTKSMDRKLPKHLVLTLNGLLEDSRLTSWTVQGNCEMTSVTIRFKMADSMEEGSGDSITKFKRVPPSQLARDKARTSQWQDRSQLVDNISSRESDDGLTFDGTITRDTKSSVPTKPVNQPQHSISTPSVTTRSKARSANPSPSPVPQTDGTCDHACEEDDNSITDIGLYELHFMAKYKSDPQRLTPIQLGVRHKVTPKQCQTRPT